MKKSGNSKNVYVIHFSSFHLRNINTCKTHTFSQLLFIWTENFKFQYFFYLFFILKLQEDLLFIHQIMVKKGKFYIYSPYNHIDSESIRLSYFQIVDTSFFFSDYEFFFFRLVPLRAEAEQKPARTRTCLFCRLYLIDTFCLYILRCISICVNFVRVFVEMEPHEGKENCQ